MADFARALFADMDTEMHAMPTAAALAAAGDDATPGRAAVGMLCAELFVGLRRVGVSGRVAASDRWGAYLMEVGADGDVVLEKLRGAVRSKHEKGLPDVAAILRDDILCSDNPARFAPHLVRLAAAVSEQEAGLWTLPYVTRCCQ